jgi:hypothetical protein
MFSYSRFLATIFTFVFGVSTVWAAGLVTAGIGVFGVPLLSSEVINVDAPRVSEPGPVRFKRHKKHRHSNCRRFNDLNERR